jgi:predicted nucleic acid binding AN1-type Zn finger protein
MVKTECGCNPMAKYTKKCAHCHKRFCDEHIFFRVDGNNGSITKYAPALCEKCYIKKYEKD